MSNTDDKENCRNAVSPASSSRNNVTDGRDCDTVDKPLQYSCGNSNSTWLEDSTSFSNSRSERCCDTEDNGSSSSTGFRTPAACSNSVCCSTSSSGASAAGVRRRATEDDMSGVCIHQKQQRRVLCEDVVASATESSNSTKSSTSSKMTGSGISVGSCDSAHAEHGVTSERSSSSCNSGSDSCRAHEGSSSSSSDASETLAVLHDSSSCSGSRPSPLTPAAERLDSSSSISGATDNNNNKEIENNERSAGTTSRNATSESGSKAAGPGAGDDSRRCETHEEICQQREETAGAAASVGVAAVGTGEEASADSTADAAGIAAAAESAALLSSGVQQQCEDGRGDEDDEEEEEEEEEEVPRISFTVKWNTKLYDVVLTLQDYECFSVADLKERLQQQLSVPADKQKLLGITNATGGRVSDSDLLQTLKFKKEKQLLLIGSSDADLLAASAAHAAAMALTDSVLNDFSTTAPVVTSEDDIRTPLHLQRLERAIGNTHVQLLHHPREGKKLLVLDLDYTLFDCKSLAGSMDDLKRPYLDEFLESVFKDYDIAVWSQTHWKWVEMKCTELGLLTNSRFHLCFVLDRSSMFTICSRKKKRKSRRVGSAAAAEELRTHEVKALEVIWRKFPRRWNATNTLHVDDLSRNFAFNPKNGIRVSAYRREKRHKDAELLLLSMYLKMMSKEEDVSAVKHKHWKDRAADLANSNISYTPSSSSSSSEDRHR